MKKSIIDLLKIQKKDQKFIIITADKNLGSCIMDIELRITRCLNDHLNKADTYEEVTEMDAILIQEDNFRWICEWFIDTTNEISDFDREFFKETLMGEQDATNRPHLKERILFAYFYVMPKMHKAPCATRPVVIGVSSVM